MSLYDNVLDECVDLGTDLNKAVKVWDWVRGNMNFTKFRDRAAYSRRENNRNTQVKIVLMEYSSTWRRGDIVSHYFVPGTNINTNCLQYDNRVIDYLHYQIADRNPTVQVYTRRKIVDGKEPHAFLRQLVVKFNIPVLGDMGDSPPSPIEKLDDEDVVHPRPTVDVSTTE